MEDQNKVRAFVAQWDYEWLKHKIVLFNKRNSALEYFYRFIDNAIPYLLQDEEDWIDRHQVKASLLAREDEKEFQSKDWTIQTQTIGEDYLFIQIYNHHDSMDFAFEFKQFNIYNSTSSAKISEWLDIQED